MKSRMRLSSVAVVLVDSSCSPAPSTGLPRPIQRRPLHGGLASTAPVQQAMPGTWSKQSAILPRINSPPSRVRTPRVAWPRHGVLFLARTVDGGAHWNVTSVPQSMATATMVSCPTVSRCYAIGTTEVMGGAVVLDMSTDFGLSWSPQTLPAGLTGSATSPARPTCHVSPPRPGHGTSSPLPTAAPPGRASRHRSHRRRSPVRPSTTCFAFEASSGAVVGTSDGTTWSARTRCPPHAAYSGRTASCPTPTYCVVVGAGNDYAYP